MKLFFSILLSVHLFGCAIDMNSNPQPSIDTKLVGVWKGEYMEKDGTIKSWTQTRKADGAYLTEFNFTEKNGMTYGYTESGQWWVKNGLFHELAQSWMKHPDVYRYRFKSGDCINFILVVHENSKDAIDDYEFLECRTNGSSTARLIYQ